MPAANAREGSSDAIETHLQAVQSLMIESLRTTPLNSVISDYTGLTGAGKMLRARIAFRVGPACRIPTRILVHAAAAVEMVHAASLLHDDVIDGGYLRRSVPAFWVERGIPGAILLGDLLLFKALDLVCTVDGGRLTHALVKSTGDVCEAETEQELLLRGNGTDWPTYVSVAQRKTGALFAFMAYVCGGEDEKRAEALRSAGLKVGTAYQLADDILDATGDAMEAGKTLGRDEARAETTAVNAATYSGADPVRYIEELCETADSDLAPWPEVRRAWNVYMRLDLRPALDRNIACFST